VKLRWLVALAAYSAACVGALFAPWPASVESEAEGRSDWALLREGIAAGDPGIAVHLVWMPILLAGAMAVWLSARRGVRAAHAELSLALALGAVAYPFLAALEPGRWSSWAGASAAALVILFSAVLGWKGLALQREELRLTDHRAVLRDY